MQKLKWLGMLAAAALVVLTAGCRHNEAQSSNVIIHGEDFPGDNDSRAIWQIRNAQAAAGARQDATLYAVHFDQGGLNSLGQQKLDLMLSDEQSAEPVVIYLDLRSDSASDKDRQAVIAFLKDRGLQDSQIALKDGPNPHAAHSASDAVNQLNALNGAEPVQSGTPGSSVPVSQNATSPGNVQPTYTSH